MQKILLPTLSASAARRTLAVSRVYLRGWRIDVLLALVLFLGALAIRLPYLMLIPNFTSEAFEVLHTLNVFQNNGILLVNADTYYGSLFNYLMAAVFYVFGFSAENARLMVAVFGALTVPLAYFFAKVTEDRLIGLVVALLMLTSGGLILMSHVAYENHTSPFFATATLLTLTLALKRASGKLLVLSGFLFGLTWQTHPGMFILGLGLALYFLIAGLIAPSPNGSRTLRSWLKSPWPYVALLAVLLAYSNVIVYNVTHTLSAVQEAQERDYAYQSSPTLDDYLKNMQNFGLMVVRMTGSTFELRAAVPKSYSLPVNTIVIILLLVGLGYTLKRRKPLPAIMLLTVGLVLPYFNWLYDFPDADRYAGYLYPLLYLLVATLLVQAARNLARRDWMWSLPLWLLALFLIVAPVLALREHYRQTERTGPTNAAVLAVYEALKQKYQAGELSTILIDRRLGWTFVWGGGSTQATLELLFTLDGIPFQTLDINIPTVESEQQAAETQQIGLVLSDEGYKALTSELPPWAENKSDEPSAQDAEYGAYIFGPSP